MTLEWPGEATLARMDKHVAAGPSSREATLLDKLEERTVSTEWT